MSVFRRLRLICREFERFAIDVVYNRRRDKNAKRLAFFLRIFSFLFGWIVRLRYKAYENRFLRSQHIGCVVIVVGNITVGGTGKTPVVEYLAKSLAKKGRVVAILSRGYKSKNDGVFKKLFRWIFHISQIPPKIVTDGKSVLLDSEVAGDEPYLLAKNLQNIPILVDKDRVNAGQYAISKFKSNALVLDDGYQYLQLSGSIYLVLVDAKNPFGNGALLPRGILREPLSHLRRANYIMLTKVDTVAPERIMALKRYIRKYNKTSPIFQCVHKPKYFQQVDGQNKLEMSDIKMCKIASLSAIASPDSFENFLKGMEADLVYYERYTDHHRFSTEDLNEFFENAEKIGAKYVITTEKDAVRIPSAFVPKIPFYFLRIEIDIIDGAEAFDNELNKLS